MGAQFAYITDLAKAVDPPDNGILTRNLFNGDQIKAVIFGFASGEELAEHTSTAPAMLYFVQGTAKLTLGDESVDAGPGTWVHMAANLKHSIVANEPVIMLLLIVRQTK